MGRGKFKSKHTGQRQFSTPEEILGTFKQQEAEYEKAEESRGEESGEESDENNKKHKGVEGIIEIENPNLVKPKGLKARDADVSKTAELSRREREELEKQRAHQRSMKEQARKDLERLSLIRQQRADAAKKREEEKAAKEQKKAQARK